MRRTHGLSYTPEYRSWKAMRQRCNNSKTFSFKNYGGRGIRICRRWDCFEKFILDMGERPTDSHTLERIDNNKGYVPSNCRWATRTDQSRNRRSNILFCFRGEIKPLMSWATQFGVNKFTAHKRVNELGWTVKQALGLEKRQHGGIGNKNALRRLI